LGKLTFRIEEPEAAKCPKEALVALKREAIFGQQHTLVTIEKLTF
jgi:hypothetical protein